MFASSHSNTNNDAPIIPVSGGYNFRLIAAPQSESGHTMKEEEWQKELESVRNQHALDVAALLSATQELQQIKQEVTMVIDAKNCALSHADDATKIAEIQAES
ncbi:hypothetical protein K1719_043810 [Acacia pycnantha]|nr:hypothetical protein K1719_043810 [Acacia pycnantha]